jgi:dihydrodiol dehydrogenase / D-xylose 1-dehydrogenase (NADP)
MPDIIRWGILSTGRIAGVFASDLNIVEGVELAAVGSRNLELAKAFSEQYSISKYYGSYEELVSDKKIDVIYVATPHMFHKDNSILCLKNGKAVLCEKAFTINAQEAKQVIDAAKNSRLFLMEGMWTRFLPVIQKCRQFINDGIIGEVQTITGDFGFKANYDPEHRLFNPELGGGALLDIGVYLVSFVSWILGKPSSIDSMATMGETGVDEHECILLNFPDGKMAKLFATLRSNTPIEILILGDKGRIRVHSPFFKSSAITLSVIGEKDQIIEMPFTGNGFVHEINEVTKNIREGKLESDIMPLNESLSIMETMDQLRKKWGVLYPSEK